MLWSGQAGVNNLSSNVQRVRAKFCEGESFCEREILCEDIEVGWLGILTLNCSRNLRVLSSGRLLRLSRGLSFGADSVEVLRGAEPRSNTKTSATITKNNTEKD